MTSLNLDVSALFNKFANKEVQIIEEERTYESPRLGKIPYTHVEIAENEPTFKEMQEIAKAKNLSLRIWLPGTAGTADFRMDRVNVDVDKDEKGTWRVGKSFRLG